MSDKRAVVEFFKELLTGPNYRAAVRYDNFDHVLDMIFQEMEELGFESTYPEGPLSRGDRKEVVDKITDLAGDIKSLSDGEIYKAGVGVFMK
jgi:hypothetical protein